MKKVLLLLAALSVVSFANEFTNKEGEKGTIQIQSQVEIIEEELKFEIEITENEGSSTITNENGGVVFHHGTVQNGKGLNEQEAEDYHEKSSVKINVKETSNSERFSGKIEYGIVNLGNSSASSPVGNPSESNLEVKYSIAPTGENTNISTENRNVEFILTSTLQLVEGNTKVYVPFGTHVAGRIDVPFSYKKAEGNEY